MTRPTPLRRHPSFVIAAIYMAVTLLLSSLSLAAEDTDDWEIFEIDEHGSLWLLGKAAKPMPDDTRNVWIKYLPVRRAPDPGGETGTSAEKLSPGIYDYSTILWIVDCRAGRFKTLRIARFDRSGNVLDERFFEDNSWSQAVVGTVPHRIISHVCGHVPTKR